MNTTTEMREYIEQRQAEGQSLDTAYRSMLTELRRIHDTNLFETERKSLVSLRQDGLKKALWRHMLQLQPTTPDYRSRPYCGQNRSWGFEAP